MSPAPASGGALREVLAALIVEHSVDGIIAVGEDGSILAFNAAAESMFGYEESDIVGSDLSTLISAGPARSADPGPNRRPDEPHLSDLDRGTVGVRRNGDTFPLKLIVSQATAVRSPHV